MPDWSRFTPADFEYDFENDKLSVHRVTFEEAIECFFAGFEIRLNKSYPDRYQLIGRTASGTRLQISGSTVYDGKNTEKWVLSARTRAQDPFFRALSRS